MITGGNHGIGLEIAKQLATRGFRVVLTARERSKGLEAFQTLKATGAKATCLPMDVSNSDSIHHAAREFAAISDRFNVLINNAGIYSDGENILTVPCTQVIGALQTNTLGPLEVALTLTQAAS